MSQTFFKFTSASSWHSILAFTPLFHDTDLKTWERYFEHSLTDVQPGCNQLHSAAVQRLAVGQVYKISTRCFAAAPRIIGNVWNLKAI